MAGLAITPENFDAEVLKSDKPVLVFLIPIDYGDPSNPNDDKIEIYDMSLEGFKSEVQKTVGDKYKVALVDRRFEGNLDLFTIAPLIFPPPLTFSVFEKGQRIKSGFLMGASKDGIFGSLKQQLGN